VSDVADVRLWGRSIGAVALETGSDVAAFEYDPAFVHSGIEIAPLTMPLSRRVFRFPELPRETLHGLPGLLADSLPDRFGHALINAWLARQGRPAAPAPRRSSPGIRKPTKCAPARCRSRKASSTGS